MFMICSFSKAGGGISEWDHGAGLSPANEAERLQCGHNAPDALGIGSSLWLIGRTPPSAPFRFSSVDNRHADEAPASRRRRVSERRSFWAKGCNLLTPA